MKLAILQMADTPQIESSAVMLRHAGYEVKVCGTQLRNAIQKTGCDTVLAVQSMLDAGYDALDPTIKEASLDDMERCDLFCEIKVRNVEKIWSRWPRLRGKTAWWRVNGARPEHVIKPDGKGNMEDCGNEMDPPCPVISANLWYGTEEYNKQGRNYVFWPPYPRAAEYDPSRRKDLIRMDNPFCLCHGINGWGFYAILARCAALGVNVYGVNAPMGVIHHSKVPNLVPNGLAMVHIKSVDCPGWAIYESMLGGCPIVVARLLINRMRGQELFKEGSTCLAFGMPGDETGRGPMEFDQCVLEIATAIDKLKDPDYNRKIGFAGRERLLKLIWSVDRDGPGFKAYMERVFG